MKDVINATDSSENFKSGIISETMEHEDEKVKASNIDKKPDIKFITEDVENTPKIVGEKSSDTKVKSENGDDIEMKVADSIKKEIKTDMHEEKIDVSPSINHYSSDVDCATILQETKDSILTEGIENDINSVNDIISSDDIKKENASKVDSPKTELGSDPGEGITEKDINSGNIKQPGNVFKRKRTRKRSRPRKRARVDKAKTEKTATVGVANTAYDADTVDAELENICSPEEANDDIEYCLTVTNLPNSWSFMDIKNYIDTQCGPVDEIEMIKDDKTGNGAIRLSYQTEEECKKAMENLTDKEIEGTKLIVSISVVNLDISDNNEVQLSTPEPPEVLAPSKDQQPAAEPETPIAKPWRPDLDIWEIDPKGLYGLKEPFLKSLGITPPLDKWVHVSNFRCDKTEIRDVLEMAGNVVMCTVFLLTPKYANVMYSHPLEAVQAVSMLNGQMYYGQKLKVVMDRSPANTILLPKGLTTIGKGLGAKGKPLRNIVQHFHRYVSNQPSSICTAAFDDPKNLDEYPSGNEFEEEEPFAVKNVEDFKFVVPNSKTISPGGNVPPITSSPVATKPATTPPVQNNAVRNIQAQKQFVPAPARSPLRSFTPQNFNQQPRNFGPNFRQFGPRPGWHAPGPDPRMGGNFGPGPRPGWNGPGPIRPMAGPRPMPGPMPGHMPGPMPGHMPGPMPGHMPGPMPGHTPGQMPGHMPGHMPGPIMGPRLGFPCGNEPVQLQFSNLPPSTTFAILCEKMAACGQVVSIQLTTPGCAVVTFANRIQADVCFQSYNNVCIEGYVVQVKYS